jgi:ankyrin repeat protein
MFYRAAVECLLSLEASVSLKDNSGCTPLHLAAWKGYDEICKLFLSLSKTAIPIDSQVNSTKVNRSTEMNIICCFSQ